MSAPRKESYTECPVCSQAEGEPVLYHRSALTFRDSFWGEEGHWECPEGHTVEAPQKPPPPTPPATG